MRQRSQVRNAFRGAAAGLFAALVMNWFQAGWSKASKALDSPLESDDGNASDDAQEPTTVKLAEKLHGTLSDHSLPEKQKSLAGNVVHYSFGAVLGALYVLVGRRYSALRAGYGVAYGAGVSIVADELLVPAIGLSPPPTEVPAKSHLYGFISHLVFGIALEGSRRLMARGRRIV